MFLIFWILGLGFGLDFGCGVGRGLSLGLVFGLGLGLGLGLLFQKNVRYVVCLCICGFC